MNNWLHLLWLSAALICPLLMAQEPQFVGGTAQPEVKGLAFSPLIPVVIRLAHAQGKPTLDGSQFVRMLAVQSPAGGHRIKGILLDSQTKGPAVGEKLVLVPFCAIAKALSTTETDALCKGKYELATLPRVTTEVSTGTAGEFAFEDLPVGEYAVFAIRTGRYDRRLAGVPISDPLKNGMLVFVLKEGESKEVTAWIPPNTMPLRPGDK